MKLPRKGGGCHTCKRRKIACDQGKPVCNNCKKSRRECEGYNSYPIFINRSTEGLQRRNRLSDAKASNSSDAVSPEVVPSARPDDFYVFVEDSPALSRSALDSTGLRSPSIKSAFVRMYVPANSGSRFLDRYWLYHAVRLEGSHAALDLALEAVCATRVGRAVHDEGLIMHGMVTYGKALKSVQMLLRDPETVIMDSTLAAVRALHTYELWESTSASLRSKDAQLAGLSCLIKLRRATMHDSLLTQTILEDTRFAAMLQAIQRRESSCFADAAWRPTDMSDPFSHIIDIGFIIASLSESVDVIKSLRIARTEDVASTDIAPLLRCLHEFNNFAKALAQWHTDYGTDIIVELGSPSADDAQDDFYYESIFDAHNKMMFWAFEILLCAISTEVRTIIQNYCNQHDVADLQELVEKFDSRHVFDTADVRHLELTVGEYDSVLALSRAALINRSMPYCLAKEHGFAGPVGTIFPSRIALYAHRMNPGPGLKTCMDRYEALSEVGIGYTRYLGKRADSSKPGVVGEWNE